jgi:hypothetical protein
MAEENDELDIATFTVVKSIDQQKHIIRYAYTDQNGQIVTGPNGYAVIECQYEGNSEYPFKIRYLNEKEKRVENLDGYAVVEIGYDDGMRVSEATFYGTKGKKKNNHAGYSHVSIRYEEEGISSVTFKNAKSLKKTVAELPLEFLLTETDSPYLSPEPFRGKRNDSRKIRYVIEAIAAIREIPLEEAMNALYRNARRVYRLPPDEMA